MISVSKRATQVNTPYPVYRARTEEDIYHCVSTVCNGKNRGSMFIESTDYDPLAITNEIINVQTLYNKCKGIRVRGVYLTITKDEFPNFIKMSLEIDEIARRFCSYIAFQGYQTIYNINDYPNAFVVNYIFNSTSFQYGYKCRINDSAFIDDATACAASIVRDVIKKPNGNPYDMFHLEYYPYSFEE